VVSSILVNAERIRDKTVVAENGGSCTDVGLPRVERQEPGSLHVKEIEATGRHSPTEAQVAVVVILSELTMSIVSGMGSRESRSQT
jgi:hypothetical protein